MVKQEQTKRVALEKQRLLETLAEGMAHEMGTPLSILQGRVEMLRSQCGEEQILDSLDSIQHQACRIQKIIETLLQYSSQAKVSSESYSKVADLLQILGEFPFTQTTTKKGLKNHRIKISKHHLELVLRHLVQNAFESYEGEDELVVLINIELQNQDLLCQIQDFGSGVQVEDQSRIFDPFFTTRRRGIGTGMGLPLTQWLIEGYGGRIDLVSTPYEGTVVTILLPGLR
jgi:two-component system, NtrC family, sensor kinase